MNFVYRKKCVLCYSNQKKVLYSKEFIDQAVWNFISKYYSSNLSKKDLANGKYEIGKCCDCGFIWQTYVLNDEFIGKLYHAWISAELSCRKKKEADISLFAGYAGDLLFVSNLLAKRPYEINVLDYGMGWGFWLLMAKAFGFNVKGFELSEDRAAFVERNGIDVIMNPDELDQKEFDFVNVSQVFEHLSHPTETLRALVLSLKNDGIIRISVPDGKGIEKALLNSGWKPSKDPIQPLEHVNCFTHQTLMKLGEANGLQPIRLSLVQCLRGNLKFGLRSVLGKYLRHHNGTTIFFTKQKAVSNRRMHQ